MSLAIVHTRALLGLNSPPVSVEVHLANGLPAFTIVGLPETAVKESKDRVRSAMINSHFDFPQRRITVNLAPADLPKEGGRFDLAIALGILAASGQVPADRLGEHEFLGELALSGELRSVKGSISAALACDQQQRTLVLPKPNAEEAGLCTSSQLLLVDNLLNACAFLHRRIDLPRPDPTTWTSMAFDKDLHDVKGQYTARRALEVAAAGGHNLLFFGPPGTGKSMLASRLPSILPPLAHDEALEVAAVKSVACETLNKGILCRPFRSPHHTSSAAAMVGGGTYAKPGEISLAHRGVLFLDELPEFPRHVLEVLREPLECGRISISRARARVDYPAQFQLVAAMNPCPCGYYGDNSGRCECTPSQVKRYREKISGPLLDRIDLHVQVTNVPVQELQSKPQGDTSAEVRARVQQQRIAQQQRQGKCNGLLTGKELHEICQLGHKEQELLANAMQRLHLSARAYDRILRVSRTIADMAGCKTIDVNHISEALAYRQLDRKMIY